MSMRDAWAAQANGWVQLVRSGLDRGWNVARPAFLGLLPPPGRGTLDVGCGEGRLGRALVEAGHRVVGVDVNFTMVQAAATHSQPVPVLVADAARLAVRDESVDLVVAFMSLLDVDDFVAAVHEAARVLEPDGHFCFTVVHPLYEAGHFQEDGSFLIDEPYFGAWRYPSEIRRAEGEVTLHSEHRPIEAYGLALEHAGFVIEALREPVPDDATIAATPSEERWRRIPNFLMVRARLHGARPT